MQVRALSGARPSLQQHSLNLRALNFSMTSSPRTYFSLALSSTPACSEVVQDTEITSFDLYTQTMTKVTTVGKCETAWLASNFSCSLFSSAVPSSHVDLLARAHSLQYTRAV